MTKNEKDMLKFFDTKNIYYNFMLSSLFITAYDLLKNSIISQVESFYTNGFDQNGSIIDREYQTDVLALDPKKNKLQASLLWLMKNNIITEEDKDKFEKIKGQRNLLAHETINILIDSEKEIDTNLLVDIKTLLKKIDQWFILEVELTTDPSMTKDEYDSIDRENVQSMRMLYLDYLMGIIFGNPEEYENIFKDFKNTIYAKYGDKF